MTRALAAFSLLALSACGASAASDAGISPIDAPLSDAFRAPDAGPVIPVLPEAARCAIVALAVDDARLRVEGTRLRDGHGREVWLRGANVGGRSKWAPFLPFDIEDAEDDVAFEREAARVMDVAASFGFDVVRMPFSWEAAYRTYGV